MRALAVVEDVVHGPGRDDAAAVTQFQARGQIGALAGAGRLDGRRGGKQRHNLSMLADLDLLALTDPIEDGAEVVPHLPDGGCFHVTQFCDTTGELSTRAGNAVGGNRG